MAVAYKSVQETKRTAIPQQRLTPSEMGGRVRIAMFDFVTPGILYPGDWVKLCPLPLSARILGGSIQVPDMSTNITETKDIDYFVETVNMKVGAYTLLQTTMPNNTPRIVTVTRTVVAGGETDTPGTIAVVGTDGDGNVISESIAVGATTVEVDGTLYFKTVTSLTGAGWVISGGNDTIVMGYKVLTGIEATMNIGIESDTARYATALAVGTAGSYAFASTIAQNFGDKISNILAQQHLIAKVPISLSEPWAAACTIKGWVRYSVD